jgi:hypothetical protein
MGRAKDEILDAEDRKMTYSKKCGVCGQPTEDGEEFGCNCVHDLTEE